MAFSALGMDELLGLEEAGRDRFEESDYNETFFYQLLLM